MTNCVNVKLCSQCQGYTEYYCYSCEKNLCSQCHESHAIDESTIDHISSIYKNTLRYNLKRETCPKHPNRFYEKYCNVCKVPICDFCLKHKSRRSNFFACFSPREHNQRMHHWNHKIIGIRTAYHTRLQEARERIHRIRTEIVSKNTVLLSKFHSDVIKCQKEIELINSDFIRKDKSLKSLCGILAKDEKLKKRCLKQMMLFSKCDTKYTSLHKQILETSTVQLNFFVSSKEIKSSKNWIAVI